MRIRFGTPAALALLLAAGCGGGEQKVPVHPVKGQVFYDGKPAAGVRVYLAPTSAPGVPRIPANPRGVTGPDGAFSLTTYAAGDGAAEGGYQVILLWPPEAADNEEAADADRLLGWYGPVHSKLTAHIKPGDNVLPPFKLAATAKLPGVPEGIPGKN